MMYILNLAEDNRILSAWRVIEGESYGNMVKVNTLPEGNIYNYQYINREYVYNPLPIPEEPEPEATAEERITDLENALTLLLEGATE